MRLPVILAALGCLLWSAAAGAEDMATGAPPPIPSLYHNDDDFHDAIGAAEALHLPHRRVSGIAVAHHLVAADLIARAFAVAGGQPLRQDHRVSRPTTSNARSGLSRPRGAASRPSSARCRRASTISIGCWPARRWSRNPTSSQSEHGIAAILPFIRHFFPGTPIVPVTVAIGSNRKEWDQFVDDIGPLITPHTLIVQSTDFSHYLPFADAIRHDQQTLNVIASGDLDAVADLQAAPASRFARRPVHPDAAAAIAFRRPADGHRQLQPPALCRSAR